MIINLFTNNLETNNPETNFDKFDLDAGNEVETKFKEILLEIIGSKDLPIGDDESITQFYTNTEGYNENQKDEVLDKSGDQPEGQACSWIGDEKNQLIKKDKDDTVIDGDTQSLDFKNRNISTESSKELKNEDFNIKNDEIGEKNGDSVKYSLDDSLSDSLEQLLIKKSTEGLDTNKINSTDTNESKQSDLEALQDDVDSFEGELKILKQKTEEQSETETNQTESKTSQKEILKQIKEGLTNNSATRSIQIMLKPHNLGKVNLNLKFFNNAMHVNVFVQNGDVEAILRENLQQIAQIVNPTGIITIEKINISKVDDYSEEFLSKKDSLDEFSRKRKENIFVPRVNKAYSM